MGKDHFSVFPLCLDYNADSGHVKKSLGGFPGNAQGSPGEVMVVFGSEYKKRSLLRSDLPMAAMHEKKMAHCQDIRS